MDVTKISELVRDFLYLTPPSKKIDYQRIFRIISNALTDSFEIKQEQEITNGMNILYDEYLLLVSKHISKYLDDIIEPYICGGSGDSYRHFIIIPKSLTIKYTGKLNQEDIDDLIDKTLYYPVKFNIEHHPNIVGSPTWHSY